jgi:hypothetical protein
VQNDRIGRTICEEMRKLARVLTLNLTREHTIDFHQLLIIHLLFFLIIESFIKLVGLRLDLFLVLIRFRIADVITKPRID